MSATLMTLLRYDGAFAAVEFLCTAPGFEWRLLPYDPDRFTGNPVARHRASGEALRGWYDRWGAVLEVPVWGRAVEVA